MYTTKVKKLLVVVALGSIAFLSSFIAATPPAIHAAASIPTVTGPTPETSDSYPFGAANHTGTPQNLSQFGYVEEEYFVSGVANIYEFDANGKAIVKTPNAAYTTRILVRRPSSPQNISGTVVVELLNPTRMYDVDFQWQFSRDYLLEHKDIWVGITIKPVAAKALKTFDSKRYAPISWANPLPLDQTCPSPASALRDTVPATENGLIWDIVSQVGALVRSNLAQNPLKEFPVDKVYLTGYSQSGGYVITYINFIRPLPATTLANGKLIYDAYLIGDGDGLYGLAPALNQCAAPVQLGDPRFIIKPRAEPVISVVSQTRVGTSAGDRRPDSDSPTDRYRRYEIPGASHVSQRDRALSPRPEDCAKTGISFPPPVCTEITAYGISDFPFEYFMDAAFANLEIWVRSGTPPPKTPLISTMTVPGSPLPAAELDKYNNALGGVRSPYVDVPIATYYGISTPGNPASRLSCTLSGYKIPFKKDVLIELYPTHDAYVKKVSEQVDAMVKERLLTKSDGQRIKNEAAQAVVP